MATRHDYFNEFITYAEKARGYSRKSDRTKALRRSGLAFLRTLNPRIPVS